MLPGFKSKMYGLLEIYSPPDAAVESVLSFHTFLQDSLVLKTRQHCFDPWLAWRPDENVDI